MIQKTDEEDFSKCSEAKVITADHVTEVISARRPEADQSMRRVAIEQLDTAADRWRLSPAKDTPVRMDTASVQTRTAALQRTKERER